MSGLDDAESDNSEPIEQLNVHKKTWNQKQLLESILKRYFHLYGEMGGSRWPIWKADVIDDNDAHETLERANLYLGKLGWMVKLEFGEPWILQVLPLPERQFPSTKSVVGIWTLTSIFLTVAGMYWMDGTIPEGGWFHSSLMLDAIIGYVIPVVSVMLLASFVQKKWAEKNGIRVGHLFPLPEPSIALFSLGFISKSYLIWPFGLLLIPSLPRMDARPWKNRENLGWISLSVPAIMICCGSILWFIGLYLTPDFVEVTSMQYIPDAPLLVNIIAILPSDDSIIQLIWAHPFTKAGSLLCFFGWLSLLPIPTFPGGRILVARVGLNDARNSSNLFFLFMIILLFAWMFEAFDGFTIWLPILGIIIPLLLFMGSDKRVPIVLDEPKGLDPQIVSKMGMALFICFMISLPSQTPFALDEDWEESIEYEFDEQFFAIYENESWFGNLEIDIINPSSITQYWSLDLARIDGIASQNWQVNWECSDDDRPSIDELGCGDEILPMQKTSVKLNLTWLNSNVEPVEEKFYLINYIDSEPNVEMITITPELDVYPTSRWQMIVSNGEIKRCLSIQSNVEQPFNVSFPLSESNFEFQTRMYWIEGEQGLNSTFEQSANMICIKGQDSIILMRASILNLIIIGESTFMPDQPSLPDRAVIPITGWNITSEEVNGWGLEINPGDILSSSLDYCEIQSKVSTPARPVNGNDSWIWDMEYRDIAQVPTLKENTSIILKIASDETVSICNNSTHPSPIGNFSVENGPELILNRGNNSHRFWTNMWAAAMNGTLVHPEMATFDIFNPSNLSIPVNIVQTTLGDGAEEWSINQSTSVLEKGLNNFEFIPSDSLFSTMRIDHQDGQVYIYLGSYM